MVALGYVLLAMIAAVVVLVILLATYHPKVGEKPDAAIVAVRTLAVVKADLPEVVSYAGRVEAERTAVLSAEQVGRVVELTADKGQAVAAGQILLTVDPASYALRREGAASANRQATNDLKRFKALHESGSVPDSDFENVVTRAQQADVALKAAELDLNRCAVTAAFAGIIQDRFVEKGEYVGPGVRAFSIVSMDRVKVSVELPERDVHAVKLGDAVPFSVDAVPDRRFEGKVAFISPAAEAKSNTFRIELGVDNTGHVLKPGVIARVTVRRRMMKDAVSVPLAALVPEKGMHVAYLVENGHAVRRQVKLDAMVGNMAVIAEGLKAGDKVVVQGQRLVSDGCPVREDDRAQEGGAAPRKSETDAAGEGA
jgi:membrane fusion protein (multidrug efflux system)